MREREGGKDNGTGSRQTDIQTVERERETAAVSEWVDRGGADAL